MERVLRLPPGFRFHPTDEEMVEQYLRKKVACCPLPAAIIPEVELSRFDPWDLPAAGPGISSKERYLFHRRERDCRGEGRCNRAAGSGYWKVTGREKPVVAGRSNQVVGMKRALVFIQGRAPRGTRTGWIMHEYRLAAGAPCARIPHQNEQLELRDWVLCHVFKRGRSNVEERGAVLKTAPELLGSLGHGDTAPGSPACSQSSCVTSEASSGDEYRDDGSSAYLLR